MVEEPPSKLEGILRPEWNFDLLYSPALTPQQAGELAACFACSSKPPKFIKWMNPLEPD